MNKEDYLYYCCDCMDVFSVLSPDENTPVCCPFCGVTDIKENETDA